MAISQSHLFSYRWIVSQEKFQKAKPKDYIRSYTFFTAEAGVEYAWHLRLFPKGCDEEAINNKKTSFFLCLLSADTPRALASYDMFVEGKSHYSGHVELKWLSGDYHVDDGVDDDDIYKKWGWKEFCPQEWASISSDSTSAVFGILLTNILPVVSKTLPAAYALVVEEADPEYIDFTLIGSDGEQVGCNKVLLAVSSPVFKAMISINMKEKMEGKAQIDDMTGAEIKSLLYFIYNESLSAGSDKHILKLAAAAEKYDLETLKQMCEVRLKSVVSEENAVEFLLTAVSYKLDFCTSFIAHYIAKNWGKMKNHSDKDKLMDDKNARDPVLNLLQAP